MVIPDLVLFVNGIPLVVMEAKSPSLLDVWKSKAVRQLRRYQEAGPEWHGTGAPELFHYNLLCVAHCGAAAAYGTLGAPENAYVEWKSVLPYSENEVRQRFGVEPQGQGATHCRPAVPGDPAGRSPRLRGLRAGARAAGEEAAPLPAVPRRPCGPGPATIGPEAGGAGRRGLAHAGIGQVVDHAVAGDEAAPRAAPGQSHHRRGHRPQAVGPADRRHLRALRLPGP